MKMVHKFATLGGKSDRARFARAGLITAALAATLLLAACGGGGGGDSSPTPLPTPVPVTPTGLITAATKECVVQQDVDKCILSVITTTANATAVSLKDSKGNSYAVTLNTAASVPVAVPVGVETYTLSFGGTTTSSVTLTGSCIPGTAADSLGKCRAPVILHYPETVYAVWTLKRIYEVGVGGVKTPIINKTSHPNAGNCGLGKVLPDGYKLANCVDPKDGKLYPAAINPADKTMIDFTGVVPADVNWVYLDTGGAHSPVWSSEAVTSTGTYYVEGLHTSILLFKDLNGVVTTAVAGTFAVDGSIGVLQTVPKK